MYPRTIPRTNIEIVRPYDGRGLRAALFDFDGTISLERDGWPNLMVACNAAALHQAVPGMSYKDAIEWAIHDIEETIGIPTYMQMKRLAAYIEAMGGKPRTPAEYKAIYNEQLLNMVEKKRKDVDDGKIRRSELLVPGSEEFIRYLRVPLYVASGTDIKPVRESIVFLGLGGYFDGEKIVAATADNPEQCAKQMVVKKLVREKNLREGELLGIGDGRPELENTRDQGGVCVGVLTPDSSFYDNGMYKSHFTVEQKRERLLEAGAHVLVPDFSCARALIEVLFSKQE